MTQATHIPGRGGRAYRFSPLRVVICGLMLFLLVAGCLFLYDSAFSFFHARLAEEEKKTMAWLTEQLSYTLPFILICVFHGMVYWKHDRRDGIAQSEMMWQVILVTGLTYCALLPYIFSVSEALHTNALAAGESFPQTDAKEDLTLILELHQWFIRLSIPLGALILFHGMRASREKRHPETEALEPVMTVAQYEAARIARLAEAEAQAGESGEAGTAESTENTPNTEKSEHSVKASSPKNTEQAEGQPKEVPVRE